MGENTFLMMQVGDFDDIRNILTQKMFLLFFLKQVNLLRMFNSSPCFI